MPMESGLCVCVAFKQLRLMVIFYMITVYLSKNWHRYATSGLKASLRIIYYYGVCLMCVEARICHGRLLSSECTSVELNISSFYLGSGMQLRPEGFLHKHFSHWP